MFSSVLWGVHDDRRRLFVLERIGQSHAQQQLGLDVVVLRPVVVKLEIERRGEVFCCLDVDGIFPAYRRMDLQHRFVADSLRVIPGLEGFFVGADAGISVFHVQIRHPAHEGEERVHCAEKSKRSTPKRAVRLILCWTD